MMRAAVLAFALLAGPALAVQPDEMLGDPALEARARAISRELRCLVCRNESIDDSSADLARDLRLLVRERLLQGDSDREVIDYIVARYGDFVLLRPRMGGANLVLWLAAPALLLAGGAVAVLWLRRQGSRAPATPLSAEERARLERILKDG
ncbi:MAG: cytochrome c-type biogenesis protein CcmH [Alphaproteobacteria bacterium]|nr:MAG: cytochrome c-type biogenesis protein CcmH [Alphaproteobacteria bacterium]